MRKNLQFKFKVSIIGDGRVGKTSLIKKFTESSFTTDYIRTIGAQFYIYNSMVNGEKIKLVFWDIAGQDDFHFLQPSFYKASNASIIVFSLEEEGNLGTRSFNSIKSWYDRVQKFCGDIPIILFANKEDLVSLDKKKKNEIKKLIDESKILDFFTTSAKTGKNVHEAFNYIIQVLYEKFQKQYSD